MKKFIVAVNSDQYRKFISKKRENLLPELRFGDVSFHKNLLKEGEICLGGGEFEFTEDSLILFGESSDFGRPRFIYEDRDLHMTGLRCPEDAVMSKMIYTFKKDYCYPYVGREDIDIKPLIKETFEED